MKFDILGIWGLIIAVIYVIGFILNSNNMMWFVAGSGFVFGIYIFVVTGFPNIRKKILG